LKVKCRWENKETKTVQGLGEMKEDELSLEIY